MASVKWGNRNTSGGPFLEKTQCLIELSVQVGSVIVDDGMLMVARSMVSTLVGFMNDSRLQLHLTQDS